METRDDVEDEEEGFDLDLDPELQSSCDPPTKSYARRSDQRQHVTSVARGERAVPGSRSARPAMGECRAACSRSTRT